MTPDQFGDHRLRVPFLFAPVARQCISLLWYDDTDREFLFKYQRSLRLSPFVLPPETESVVYAPPAITERALAWIRLRYDTKARHHARHLFAAAAHRQARRFQVKLSVDMLVLYAGLVKGYAKQPEMTYQIMAVLGGVLLDERIIAVRPEHREMEAGLAAHETCMAFAKQFEHAATIPESDSHPAATI